MKKVWAVELDLLAEFARVCEKHNIRWYADGGTLLGAVRHKGFIPWDDDVDVIMMRENYERLCKIAQEEFAYPYLFEDLSKRCLAYGQLYNASTTLIAPWTKSNISAKNIDDFGYQQFIYIDIFIADNMPDSSLEFARMRMKAIILKKVAKKLQGIHEHYHPSYTAWKIPIKATMHYALKMLQALGVKIPKSRDLFHKHIKVISSYGKDTKRVGNLAFLSSNRRKVFGDLRSVWNRSDFSGTIRLPFEMLTLPVASGYENILTKLYGNWREYVIMGRHGAFYDTEHPYMYYYDKLKAGENIWLT